MNWIKENWFKLGWLVVALIIASSLAYYFIAYIPKLNQAKLDQATQAETNKFIAENAAEAERETKLDNCLADADTNYSSFWDTECSSQGLQADCRLPSYNADRVTKKQQTDKDNCFKEYK